jgi:ribosomal protein S12 methylthiotransferase accessory factor
MEMKITLEGKAKVIAEIGGMKVVTDQPIPSGDGTAPTPFNLFLASIGTCAGIFVKAFCDQRGIPTNQIYLTQKMNYDHSTHLISDMDIVIHLPADFPEKYKNAVINAADLCLVKRHFSNPPAINTSAVIG